jgi:hypothetical protein
MSRRRVFAAGLASALVLSVGLFAQTDKKTEEALKKEAQALSKLSKKSELSVFFLIYNPKGDSSQKPDINIEYNFCQAAPGNQPKPEEPCKAGEKFYNKTEPQVLNATTVPPAFDLSMGHQLQTGQAVPLAQFPEGDYRLEIKVTDKLANKTVTRDVNFSVAAS